MSKLSKNIIYNLIGQGLILILGFISVKYVFKQLGEDALGIIYFTLTLNAVLCALLEMGIGSTTVREVSAHFGDEPGYIRDFIRTTSLYYWTAYLLLVVGIYWGAPFFVEKWIILKSMDGATAIGILRVLGISALLALPHTLYISLFRGLQRMEFNNLIDVSVNGLQQFGTIMILILGGDLFHVVYWFALCFVGSIMAYTVIAARFFSWRALLPRYSSEVVRRNWNYAAHMTAISFLAMIHTQADKIIISKLMPIGMFGYYGLAWGTVSRVTLVTNAIAQAAFPSFSSSFKHGDRTGLMAQYRKLHDLLCFSTIPLFAAIPFATLPVFGYLFNREVAQILLVPITFLCIGYYMNGTLNVPYVFSLATGKPEIGSRSNFYSLFIVLPVTVVLVYFFGLSGAGFSWVFYHLFSYSYSMPRVCSECLEIPVSEWYWHLLRIYILAGWTYGGAWMLIAWIGDYNLKNLVLAYVAASLVFIIGAYPMIGGELRETLFGLLHKWKTIRPRAI